MTTIPPQAPVTTVGYTASTLQPAPMGYASPVTEDKVETVTPLSPFVKKYNLQTVEIANSELPALKHANEFMVYFKKRLNQFLLEAGKITETLTMDHAAAGGYLSDAYMKMQPYMFSHLYPTNTHERPLDSKDMDLFMQVPVELFKGLSMEQFTRQLEKELSDEHHLYVHIKAKTYDRHFTYTFMSIPYIFEVAINGMPLMEIILCNDLERIMDFDISIRHFFNFGDDQIYASQFAIDTIARRELVVVCPITPKSTLVRLFYFQKRYGFTIDFRSLQLLTWSFQQMNMPAEDLIEYATTVEKFRHNGPLRRYILNHVYAYLENYTTAEENQVLRRNVDSHRLFQYIAGRNEHVRSNEFNPEQTMSYFGKFDSHFPYNDLFYTVYRFIARNNIYDVLFSAKFPHGFFGKFYSYIQGNKTSTQFLEDCGTEYIELLKKCNTEWPDYAVTYEEAEEAQSEYAKQKEEAKFLSDLHDMFTKNKGLANKYLNRSTKKLFNKPNQYFPMMPVIELDPETFSADDVPNFIKQHPHRRPVSQDVGFPAPITSEDLPF